MTDIEYLFNYWKETMEHPRAKLTPKRQRKIKQRLKEDYTVEDIINGIDGCFVSEFHQGRNDNGTIYDDIELICRSGEKLEQFILVWERASAPVESVRQ